MLAHALCLIREGCRAAERSRGTPWLTRNGILTVTGDEDVWVTPLESGHHSSPSVDACDIFTQGEGGEADELRAGQDWSPNCEGRGHFHCRADTETQAAEEGDCPVMPCLPWDVDHPRVQHVSTPWTFSAAAVTVPQGLHSSHPFLIMFN